MSRMMTGILGVALVGASVAGQAETEDLKAFEKRVLEADGRPPELRTDGLGNYSTNRLDFALNNGLAVTRGGRLWASWISGGDGPRSFTAAAWSDDGGETWTDTKLVIDGHDGSKTERTNIIGTFWLDPDGKLRCYTDQSVLHFDGRAGVWESVCANPDDAEPVWSKARRIGNGHVMNKPIVLANGDWALPAYLNGTWRAEGSSWRGAFASLDDERGATCFVSSDRGKTWEKRATVKFPAERRKADLVEDWQEAQLVALKDGTLRMFARVIDGNVGCLMAADSKDGGRTFAPARRLWTMNNTNARFQIQRLKSGRLIFVKHGVPDAFSLAWSGRRQLTAYVSDDDGATWKGGLVLDWDNGSYPDLCQAEDGYVYVSHDHGRSTQAEIWLHRFTEEDVLARRIVSSRGKLNLLVMRAMGSDYNRRKRASAGCAGGRTELFNGRDLTGWTAVVDHDVTGGYGASEPTWFVTEGAIRTTGTPFGYLRTKRTDFGDFKLHVEYRWWRPTAKPNSGVFVRLGKEHGTFLPTALENQLCRGSAGDILGLAGFEIPGFKPRNAFDASKPLSGITKVFRRGADVEKPFGAWNVLEVDVRGDTLVNRLNGVVLNRVSGIAATHGAIALQAEGGAAEFRNVWIEICR